ncbi:MAG TPA: hypothetical protein VGR96_01095 [Acidobacteriaceae bacterium]|nr:hypothetical protein [Acidobacteriaceae bacterium]
MKKLIVTLCIAAATAVSFGASSILTGNFAYQGGRAITQGHMQMTPVPGDPLKQHIEIWMTPPNSTQPIRNYAVEMTKKLHVVVVSKDFSTFIHIHPVLGPDGHFRIDQPFAKAGEYYLYADGEPNDGDHQVFRFDLTVSKAGPAKSPDLTPTGREVSIGPYTVDLSKAKLSAGGMDMIEVQILKGDAPATDLHPYLGSPAHAVFLNSRDLSYVHVHPTPMGQGAAVNMMGMSPSEMRKMTVELPDSSSSPPNMMLHVSVREPGIYKMWLQFRGGDQLYVAPFVLTAN